MLKTLNTLKSLYSDSRTNGLRFKFYGPNDAIRIEGQTDDGDIIAIVMPTKGIPDLEKTEETNGAEPKPEPVKMKPVVGSKEKPKVLKTIKASREVTPTSEKTPEPAKETVVAETSRVVVLEKPSDSPLASHDVAACGCVYIGRREFSCGFKA